MAETVKMEWRPIETAPENVTVQTKIDDSRGVRNEQPFKCSGCGDDAHPGMSDCYRASVVPVHGTPTIEDCVGGR